jgi:hypothetical protein
MRLRKNFIVVAISKETSGTAGRKTPVAVCQPNECNTRYASYVPVKEKFGTKPLASLVPGNCRPKPLVKIVKHHLREHFRHCDRAGQLQATCEDEA